MTVTKIGALTGGFRPDISGPLVVIGDCVDVRSSRIGTIQGGQWTYAYKFHAANSNRSKMIVSDKRLSTGAFCESCVARPGRSDRGREKDHGFAVSELNGTSRI
jgi:hypothetical protein